MKYKSVINPCTYDIRREYRRITWLKEENFSLRRNVIRIYTASIIYWKMRKLTRMQLL